MSGLLNGRRYLIENDKKDLRETKLLDRDKFPFSVDQINIFANKMFIVSYKDLLVVMIESFAISKTMKSIFELAWLGAKQVKKV